MSKNSLVSDVHGASRLAIDLTVVLTDVVETMHHNIVRRRHPLGNGTLAPTTGLTGVVYRTVRGVTRLVGRGIDGLLGPLTARLAGAPRGPGRDAAVAALNGVLGDHLEATGNPLCIRTQLRVDGKPLTLTRDAMAARLPQARQRVIVMVHGLCLSDASWHRGAHDHATCLARDFDATVVYLRYNSGRHISTNGAEFAALLQRMADTWPVPLRELVLVGHSMGGLVIRSACDSAEASASGWIRALRAIAFLGTPHHGAPLERAGHGLHVLLTASPYTVAFARLAGLRSAGITDLRYGSVHDDDWMGRDRFARRGRSHAVRPLPAQVPAFTLAGSLSKRASKRGTAYGDGLVPVASALGRHADPASTLAFPAGRTAIAYGTGHLDLLSSEAVYRKLRRWLLVACRSDRATHGTPRATAHERFSQAEA